MINPRALIINVIGYILLVAVAAGAGYYVRGVDEAKKVAKQQNQALKNSAQNVVVSVAESQRIETEVAKVDENVASIKAAVVKRGVTLHPKKEANVETIPGSNDEAVRPESGSTALVGSVAQSSCDAVTGFYLDNGTVGLLNAARQGRGVGSAGGSNEAQSAPSTVEVTDLIANDLDVVQMYLDLARRHDELVDSVEKHLQDKAR